MLSELIKLRIRDRSKLLVVAIVGRRRHRLAPLAIS